MLVRIEKENGKFFIKGVVDETTDDVNTESMDLFFSGQSTYEELTQNHDPQEQDGVHFSLTLPSTIANALQSIAEKTHIPQEEIVIDILREWMES